MRPPKQHLSTLMLSLCIVASALLASQAAAVSRAAPDFTGSIKSPGYDAHPLKLLGEVTMSSRWRRPIPRPRTKAATLSAQGPLGHTSAPWSAARVPSALARGMTFKKLLRRGGMG
ncbi:hypothetical protein [Pseudomonas extremorientalis]|uniref:Uncharacterized protein n=1 Tax=Pseudomonas extremorientalis TaxID=169669 RepID=A0A1H0Q4Y9_9PSED|nr:hypothetical protein [Pseudomonas extremorientalis]KAB0522088.1 hypothetical protein F7R08_02660 [Pseudomonas extremorientalis]OIN10728.1 hypothetical protein BFN10_08530 [Pseudomonas extremorientalis]SDP12443.1 hypothetical protein SAMN04490184_2360 [Pseudomonas extremorientalis]